MAKAISGIYIILNTKSKKVYLGQSQDIKKRWASHKRSLDSGTHYNPYLQRAWSKYGAEAFKFQILEYCLAEHLNEREQHFLDVYIEKGLCYNIALDATAPMRGRTHKHSDETRRRMSEIATGRVFSEEHRQHLSEAQRKRAPVSPETRRKISDAVKARPPMSDEQKKKLSEIGKMRVHPPLSDETRRKMSIAQKGKIHASPSNETRIKIGNASRGRKHSPEARRKISEAGKGHIVSDLTRKKIGEAHRGKPKPPLSDDAKLKISAAIKGIKRSEETKQKIRENSRNVSDETRQKRRESMLRFLAERKMAENE